jgi:hypothetical protein
VKFLVDANVLSEATKPRPASSVLKWLRDNERQLAVNPIVLGELEYGILLLPAGQRRNRLLKWFQAGLKHLRVLDFDAGAAREWAALLAELKRNGRAMPIKDSLIAATARQHRLTVVTRNTEDFTHTGVPVLNPFED